MAQTKLKHICCLLLFLPQLYTSVMVLFLSAAIKTRCVSLHGLASALLAHDGHAASHRTNVNLSLTYGQSGEESKQFILSGLIEISRSAVLTDLMSSGREADERTCSGLAEIVLEGKVGSDFGAHAPSVIHGQGPGDETPCHVLVISVETNSVPARTDAPLLLCLACPPRHGHNL